jgi:hypothetical protein
MFEIVQYCGDIVELLKLLCSILLKIPPPPEIIMYFGSHGRMGHIKKDFFKKVQGWHTISIYEVT